MKKQLIQLIVIIIFLSACTQQVTEEPISASPPTESIEATPKPTTTPTSEPAADQTPELTTQPTPEPYAVSEAFVNEITTNMPLGLLEGLNEEIYEPLLGYYHSFQIREEGDQIILQFIIEDTSFTQTIENTYETTFGPFNEDGNLEIYDNIGMFIGEFDGETSAEFIFNSADYPDFRSPSSYAEQIQLPELPEDALPVGRNVKGFEWGEKIIYECEYELPEVSTQIIIDDLENKLSELVEYQTYENVYDGMDVIEYRALLAPGAELYAVSTQEMILFEVTLRPLTILNSGFAYEAAADPANTLLSIEADKIYSAIKSGDKSISILRGEDTLICDMFFEYFESAYDVAAFIAEAYGVDNALELLQDYQDIEIPLADGQITIYGFEFPQALRIIVETMDETSIQKMTQAFSAFPDELFPAFPESISTEFSGDYIGVNNGSFSYFKSYAIDSSDYSQVVNYFTHLFDTENDDTWIEENGNCSTSISTRVEGIYLEVFVFSGDDINPPYVEIRLSP